MRASDEDRHRTVEELRRHCAAGRIDVDEYASRVERALSAATLEELDAVRSDLPMLRVPEPAGSGVWAGRSAGNGTRLPASTRSRRGGERDESSTRLDTTLAAALVAAITVVVVLAAIVVGLVAEWAWAVVLIAGWAAGVVQGRLSRHAKRHR